MFVCLCVLYFIADPFKTQQAYKQSKDSPFPPGDIQTADEVAHFPSFLKSIMNENEPFSLKHNLPNKSIHTGVSVI